MAEEQNQEITSPDPQNNVDVDQLKASIAALEKKRWLKKLNLKSNLKKMLLRLI